MTNSTFKFKTSADYKLNIGANELKPSDMAKNIPAFSPFPPMFSKYFCCRVVKNQGKFRYELKIRL